MHALGLKYHTLVCVCGSKTWVGSDTPMSSWEWLSFPYNHVCVTCVADDTSPRSLWWFNLCWIFDKLIWANQPIHSFLGWLPKPLPPRDECTGHFAPALENLCVCVCVVLCIRNICTTRHAKMGHLPFKVGYLLTELRRMAQKAQQWIPHVSNDLLVRGSISFVWGIALMNLEYIFQFLFF